MFLEINTLYNIGLKKNVSILYFQYNINTLEALYTGYINSMYVHCSNGYMYRLDYFNQLVNKQKNKQLKLF